MANTGTYTQAKNIYNDALLMEDNILSIIPIHVPNFRKHLTEFEYRKQLGRQFTTKILDNNKILVKRIK